MAVVRSSAYAFSSLSFFRLHQHTLGSIDDLAFLERYLGVIELGLQAGKCVKLREMQRSRRW